MGGWRATWEVLERLSVREILPPIRKTRVLLACSCTKRAAADNISSLQTAATDPRRARIQSRAATTAVASSSKSTMWLRATFVADGARWASWSMAVAPTRLDRHRSTALARGDSSLAVGNERALDRADRGGGPARATRRDPSRASHRRPAGRQSRPCGRGPSVRGQVLPVCCGCQSGVAAPHAPPDLAHGCDPRTNRALSCRSISNGVMHLTPRLMHASGILILFVDVEAISWVTTVCP
jgi:hypothetical protein